MSNSILPVSEEATKDIFELEAKIDAFQNGKTDEEKFRHFRLTRGVYGQRQAGVQMVRIKLPYGGLSPKQLSKVADLSDRFSTGKLHLTTRQNIQLHYVKLADSPALWQELESVGLTLREACGNTVRNVTASPNAGLDPDEPFDVTPYAEAFFRYFLRHPICQDMGRKIKVAFSSSEKDSAFTFFHDLGFIPRLKVEDGVQKRGFKVVIGGGLGAQPRLADTIYDFLEEDRLLPFSEALIRVFDRYGERKRREKARMKFLVKKLGADEILRLAEAEFLALSKKSIPIEFQETELPPAAIKLEEPASDDYLLWKKTNVFPQKQMCYVSVGVRIRLGDLQSDEARALASLVDSFDTTFRSTLDQGLLIRNIPQARLPELFGKLKALNFQAAGVNSTHDVTSCPGSDTCNLAVTNSTGLAEALENLLQAEFPHLAEETNLRIRISGCMNSCGQHMVANIGFHGSSIRKEGLVVPAMQVVLGGGLDREARGFIAEKVIKIPTRKAPEALRTLVLDYEKNRVEDEYFNDYYQRLGKKYFYELLKFLADKNAIAEEDYIDWKQETRFQTQIGVGECAGVSLDAVSTILAEAREKIERSENYLSQEEWDKAAYESYNAHIIAAKAILLSQDISCNTQMGIMKDFDGWLQEENREGFLPGFEEQVSAVYRQVPNEGFAREYFQQANHFVNQCHSFREESLKSGRLAPNQSVINHYYKA